MFEAGLSIGQKLMNSLGITLMGMGIVFIVLILLSLSLDFLRFLTIEKKKNKEIEKLIEESVEIENSEDENDEELVAVITVALAEKLNKKSDELIIRNIKRTFSDIPNWAAEGIKNNMN